MTILLLEQRIARLEAIEDIKRLKALYCLHCDRNYDPDSLAALFTEDAVWDAGALRGIHRGREAIRTFFSEAVAKIPYAAHLVCNPVIDVSFESDRARGQWRMLMPCDLVGGDGRAAAFQVASYDDEYRREDGTWLIAHLKVRLQRLTFPGTVWSDLSGGER